MKKYNVYIAGFIITVFVILFYELTGYRKGDGFVEDPLSVSQLIQYVIDNWRLEMIKIGLGTFLMGKAFELMFKGNGNAKK